MSQEQADPKIVVPAAILHQADPEIVRAQLLRLGFAMTDIEMTVQIVQSLQNGATIQSPSFGVVHDACLLTGISDGDVLSTGDGRLLTDAGKELATATAGSTN